jgi:hypothetical protein
MSASLQNKTETSYRVTGFSDFFHRPVFLGLETRRFGNWICFRHQVKEGGGEDTWVPSNQCMLYTIVRTLLNIQTHTICDLRMEPGYLSRHSDRLNGLGSMPGWGNIFLFTPVSTPDLGPTQPPNEERG